MNKTISLNFAGETKDVALRTTITTRMVKKVAPHIDGLRKHGTNRALLDALATNPQALHMITGDGAISASWIEDNIKAMQAEHVANTGQEMPYEDVQKIVQQKLAAQLIDQFPEVFTALRNPSTVVDMTNAQQMIHVIDIVKELIDDKNLSTLEREAMAGDEFWLDQDLREVCDTVAMFRDELQSRA